MERYCSRKAVLAENLIDAGLEGDARHLLFVLQKCAALSDCAQWRHCAQIADRIETTLTRPPVH